MTQIAGDRATLVAVPGLTSVTHGGEVTGAPAKALEKIIKHARVLADHINEVAKANGGDAFALSITVNLDTQKVTALSAFDAAGESGVASVVLS